MPDPLYNLQGPYGFSFSPMLVANSGSPFNIVTGQDLNGDNQFNDRPVFATATSTDVLETSYGMFDLNPAGDAARIPYNYGTGPGQFSMNARISKSFGIGPKVEGGSKMNGGFGAPAALLPVVAPVAVEQWEAASDLAASAAAEDLRVWIRALRADTP